MTTPPAWLVRVCATALRTRWFVRSTIGMYRRGWGWMLGDRLLMLEHRGRRSGLVRRVVLEMIGQPRPGRYLVVAGFGERADWLRNVRAHPGVRVSAGRLQSEPAQAHEVSAAEAEEALAAYRAEHPIAWSVLSSTMEQSLGAELTTLPVVAVDLDEVRRTPDASVTCSGDH